MANLLESDLLKQLRQESRRLAPSGLQMSKIVENRDENVPAEVYWFEEIWNQFERQEVAHVRLDKKRADFIFVPVQIDDLRVISGIVVGPKGGVQEHLYVYDTKYLRAERLRTYGEIQGVDNWLGALTDAYRIRQEVKSLKGQAKRETALTLVIDEVAKVPQQTQDPQKLIRIKIAIGEQRDAQSQSIGGINVGSISGDRAKYARNE